MRTTIEAPLHAASTAATRSLTTRRPQFDYSDGLRHRHLAQRDLLTSHLVAVMSALIPEGEKFVVDAVKRYRSDLDDANLRTQANTFVGQESMHQREHDRLNATLRAVGYPMRLIDRLGSVTFGLARRLPRPTQLALTAAIEHWTAIIAEFSLAGDRPSVTYIDDEVRAFLTWHLIEEIEHKSVAFDVMQALGTTEAQRIMAMRQLALLVSPVLVVSLLASLATDPAAWDPRNIARSIEWIRTNSTFAEDGFGDAIRAWSREGFHPDERDHTELLERWRDEAFGPGSIVEQRSRRPLA